ncbi:hypothetical protein B0H10DRAFT_2234020 [Mycena sp. CBHHK59/15]|nr:hypothetical protein B0H10DRAFT_2234020 [Mycena sp. CBHHK59/15]
MRAFCVLWTSRGGGMWRSHLFIVTLGIAFTGRSARTFATPSTPLSSRTLWAFIHAVGLDRVHTIPTPFAPSAAPTCAPLTPRVGARREEEDGAVVRILIYRFASAHAFISHHRAAHREPDVIMIVILDTAFSGRSAPSTRTAARILAHSHTRRYPTAVTSVLASRMGEAKVGRGAGYTSRSDALLSDCASTTEGGDSVQENGEAGTLGKTNDLGRMRRGGAAACAVLPRNEVQEPVGQDAQAVSRERCTLWATRARRIDAAERWQVRRAWELPLTVDGDDDFIPLSAAFRFAQPLMPFPFSTPTTLYWL